MHGFEDPLVERLWRKEVQGKTRSRRLRHDNQLDTLLRTIACTRRLALNDLFDDDRTAAASYARHVGMYLAHVCLGRSQKAVAILFGRSTSTVSHACRRVELLRDDPLIDAEIAEIERQVRKVGKRRAN